MGRHSKLDDDRLERILDAVRLGLSEREAAEACGICERTWYNWKARARAASEILPADWDKLRFEELLACAEELGIDLAGVRRTGHNGRLTRADLLRVLRERAEKYVVFLREVDSASPAGKLAILRRVDDLVQGRVRVKRTRTTQTVKYIPQPNGQVSAVPMGEAVITTEVLELPPDRQAALKMLEMRWPEEFGRRQGDGPRDPEAAAKEVTDRVHQMLTTVPPPPALPPAPEGKP